MIVRTGANTIPSRDRHLLLAFPACYMIIANTLVCQHTKPGAMSFPNKLDEKNPTTSHLVYSSSIQYRGLNEEKRNKQGERNFLVFACGFCVAFQSEKWSRESTRQFRVPIRNNKGSGLVAFCYVLLALLSMLPHCFVCVVVFLFSPNLKIVVT